MSVVAQVRRLAALEAVPNLTTRRVVAVLAFAAATGLGAHVWLPLPGLAVPVTLQTLFVVLSGLMLGPRLGAASQATYLAAGLMGLPVFAPVYGPAALVGPTGGYLVAFPAAAWLAGWVVGAPRPGLGSFLRLALATLLGGALILAVGASWLSIWVGGLGPAFFAGVVPFLVGDALKSVVALLAARRVRERVLGQL